jgi:hypothetical protein
MTRISRLSEALKFTELYVQILRSGFTAVAAIDASSVKAKQIADLLNERRVNLALTISSWDSDLQSVALNSWLGCMNWIDSKPAEKSFKDALIDSICLVLATQSFLAILVLSRSSKTAGIGFARIEHPSTLRSLSALLSYHLSLKLWNLYPHSLHKGMKFYLLRVVVNPIKSIIIYSFIVSLL